MAKEGLSIGLLKSLHSFYESYKSKSNNARIEKIIKEFNRLRQISETKNNWKKAL